MHKDFGVIERVQSEINGDIRVVRDLILGTCIQTSKGSSVQTQSGGMVYVVWKQALLKTKEQLREVNRCLILGLGGGSSAMLVSRFWPSSKITGVEIDPVLIYLGKKYLGLDDLDIDIKIEDAYEYLKCQKSKAKSQKYELILIDVFVGDSIPKKFESKRFIYSVKRLLTRSGVAVFNRLYCGRRRKDADEFHKLLVSNFGEIREIHSEANVMYVCSGN